MTNLSIYDISLLERSAYTSLSEDIKEYAKDRTGCKFKTDHKGEKHVMISCVKCDHSHSFEI